MSDAGPMVLSMDETFSPHIVTISVPCTDGQLLDAGAFAAAASRAAWRRSATVVSTHAAGRVVAVVTVEAPGRYAAVAVARAVVSDALRASGAALSPAPGQLAA
jgi:hypothetical protein